MMRLLILNGPNLNLLGQRETDVYGTASLDEIVAQVKETVQPFGYEVEDFQSNHEGELIDRLHVSKGKVEGIIFNPAAYTHTSIAIRDAISAIETPVIEVHLSNVHKREAFRHQSLIAPVCEGQIVGLGIQGYRLAALALVEKAKSEGRNNHV
ncbi:type II 3-dehydroquinate dehydratase [Thalassobacillus hwangdonensis]|uniref:3-dehydroquinate dehydratase n=1 Tax=Thalassobacillus hwangdonensis TaxID=546108 RepID=A0ABW3L0L5_9BACI